MKYLRYILALPSIFVAMALSKLIVTPVLIWIFNQVWIIKALSGITHFVVRLFFRNNYEAINFTIDSYIEEGFGSFVGIILGLFAGLVVIPTINKKYPLLCFSLLFVIISILVNYTFMSIASDLKVPIKMVAERSYVIATSFIIAGQILGTFIVWWIYSLYEFQNPFSKAKAVN